MPQRRPPLRLPLIVALLAAGCGEGDARPPVQPVAGRVLVDGKPAARARVTFHRSPASPAAEVPYAESDADGAFRPTTRLTGDGTPAGDYDLTVIWPEIRVDHGEEVAGADRLKGRYDTPQKSNLKATIREGENTLPPLELKTR